VAGKADGTREYKVVGPFSPEKRKALASDLVGSAPGMCGCCMLTRHTRKAAGHNASRSASIADIVMPEISTHVYPDPWAWGWGPLIGAAALMLGCYLVFGVLAPVQGTLPPVLDLLPPVMDNVGTVFASIKTDLPEVSLLPHHVDRASCSPPTAPRHVGCQRWLVSKLPCVKPALPRLLTNCRSGRAREPLWEPSSSLLSPVPPTPSGESFFPRVRHERTNYPWGTGLTAYY
jgi:hypothetical protein